MLSCLKFPSVYFPLRRKPPGFAFSALTDPDMRRCEGWRGAVGAILRLPFRKNSAFFHIRSTWREADQARQMTAAFPQKSAHSKLPQLRKCSWERIWAQITYPTLERRYCLVFTSRLLQAFVILHLAKKPSNLTKKPALGLSEHSLSVPRFCQPERKLNFRRIRTRRHQQSPKYRTFPSFPASLMQGFLIVAQERRIKWS